MDWLSLTPIIVCDPVAKVTFPQQTHYQPALNTHTNTNTLTEVYTIINFSSCGHYLAIVNKHESDICGFKSGVNQI